MEYTNLLRSVSENETAKKELAELLACYMRDTSSQEKKCEIYSVLDDLLKQHLIKERSSDKIEVQITKTYPNNGHEKETLELEVPQSHADFLRDLVGDAWCKGSDHLYKIKIENGMIPSEDHLLKFPWN